MVEKFFYMKSAWMVDCCEYYVAFFDSIFSRLTVSHSRISSQQVHTFALSKMSSPLYHA